MFLQSATLTRFSARLALSGLIIPIIAVAWSAAFKTIYDAFLITGDEYGFIFAVSWGAALLRNKLNPATSTLAVDAELTPRAYRLLCKLFPVGSILAFGTSGFLLLFRLGVGIFPFLFPSGLFGLALLARYLFSIAKRDFRPSILGESIYAGIVLAFATATPAYFEKMSGYANDFMISAPVWYTGIYFSLILTLSLPPRLSSGLKELARGTLMIIPALVLILYGKPWIF